ncbi:MAG: hypothetical protein FD122_1503 [Stygiobacter sp.]|nr:MAG: hypothetical protein FD122_1503 [Stygiobacter sp.]KAF0217537.1 MAG: hypothetical protein FD178_581 [Ignavibacteria bacterium]
MKKLYSILLFVTLIAIAIACKENTSETNQPTEPAAYIAADGIKGGIRYDNFFATEASFSKASDASLLAKLNASADFFRCKQCHGWDLLGTSGSYNNRAPKANRPNVSSVNIVNIVKTKTEQQLFEALKTGSTTRRDISFDLTTYNPTSNATVGDQMPNYSQLLTDAEIWDLVKFLKKDVLDVSQLYDATYTGTYPTGKMVVSNIGKDGNATNGKTYFNNKCAICHGTDGKLIPNLDKTTGMTYGKFMRTKANEAQHKIKFGQLGSTMKAFKTTTQEMKDLYKAATDTITYPNK